MYTCIAGHIASLYHACDYCNCESPTDEAKDSRVGANKVDNVFKVRSYSYVNCEVVENVNLVAS